MTMTVTDLPKIHRSNVFSGHITTVFGDYVQRADPLAVGRS